MKEQVYHIPTMEKIYITEALVRSNNSQTKAAEMLGVTTRTLLRKREQYGIKIETIKELIKTRKQ